MSEPTRERFSSEDLTLLMAADEYRALIRTVIHCRSSRGKRFSYSDIARVGGFKARSFPRDVALGLKNLSPSSLYGFTKGLGLSGELAEYFRLLVEIAHPQCRTKPTTLERLNKLVSNLRKRILAKRSSQIGVAEAHAFGHQLIPLIYAALGTLEDGTSFDQILSRTKLSKSQVTEPLQKMIDSGLVRKNRNQYFALSNHLDLPNLNSNQIFRDYFFHMLDQSKMKAELDFSGKRNLHFSSSFSISSSEIGKLREDLRSTLSSYVDAAENAKGDEVVSLVCSLF